jgi:hypothetical protein
MNSSLALWLMGIPINRTALSDRIDPYETQLVVSELDIASSHFSATGRSPVACQGRFAEARETSRCTSSAYSGDA